MLFVILYYLLCVYARDWDALTRRVGKFLGNTVEYMLLLLLEKGNSTAKKRGKHTVTVCVVVVEGKREMVSRLLIG